jgi:uncharacterized membrane protein YjgN (DUF898 family)
MTQAHPTATDSGFPGASNATSSGTSPVHGLRYHGDGTSLFGLLIKNFFLTLLTLGLYYPWAKTERRRYMWSHTELAGHRLVYTGTGVELLTGYLKVAAAYVVFFGTPMIAGAVSKKLQVALQLALFVVIFAIVPFAIYWSRAFLLSRTRWRGVSFGLGGSAKVYAKAFIGGTVLSVLTLGLYSPYLQNNLQRILTSNTRFGTERFGYDGQGGELFRIWIKGVLLSIVTLGIYSFWLSAALQRYRFEHTTFMGARGRLDVTGGLLLKLFLIHVLGTTLTLGIAFPWIITHVLRTVLERTSFVGPVDLARVAASPSETSAVAEGVADALGVDLGI